MEIDSEKKEETIPSSPSTVQRERVIDPVDPVDVPRDIVVVQKRLAWARRPTESAGGRGTCISLWYIPREQETEEIFDLCFSYEPHH
jgi:hypothetical protein